MKRKWTNETVDNALVNRKIIRITNLERITAPSITKILWRCTKCSVEWKTTVDSVLNLKSGCPCCAGNRKMSLDDLQDRLHKRKITTLQLFDGHKNKERKGLFQCNICKNQWTMILSNLLGKRQGCPRCGKSGRYTEKWFKQQKSRKRLPGKIYLLELSSTKESFLKVGITKRNIKTRFTTSIPYTTTILVDEDTTLYTAFRIEQEILKLFSNKRYNPQKHFGGKRECFTLLAKAQLIRKINESLHTV